MSEAVALAHPGEMGAAVGAAALATGAKVRWASEGRSPASRARAAEAGLEDLRKFSSLVEQSEIVLSICPPYAARDVATDVTLHDFGGVFVDANAISPGTARAIAAEIGKSGATFVDGGIIGGPPRRPGTTRIYLSGSPEPVQRVAALFEGSPLEAIPLDAPAGAASALKVCFASWTKGTSALLGAIRALARHEEVEDALLREWSISLPDLVARSEGSVRGSARKAWRFVGEMEEIARTYADADLPDGFHRAAAEIYRRLDDYKDATEPPPLDRALAALLRKG